MEKKLITPEEFKKHIIENYPIRLAYVLLNSYPIDGDFTKEWEEWFNETTEIEESKENKRHGK